MPAYLLASVLLALAPPSGRPPTGALQRSDAKVYDFSFRVTLTRELPDIALEKELHRTFALADTPIVMPVIFLNTFSQVDADSLSATLWQDHQQDPNLHKRTRLEPDKPFNMQFAVIPIARFQGQTLRWRFSQRVKVWASKVDEDAAARVTWPRDWPDEVQRALKPQRWIESDDPIFKKTVDRVSEGKLRQVPLYFAAKDLIRYTIANVQITNDGEERREFNTLHGLEIAGAKTTAETGKGGPHDLVCVCVAILRAAGIPARPIIGAHENDADREEFVSWAEFYLPGSGWVPFDPNEMKGKGLQHKNVRQPWPYFGTIDELNERIPLSFFFHPPAKVQTPEYPAVWGWDPRPSPPRNLRQVINFTIISRGSGKNVQ